MITIDIHKAFAFALGYFIVLAPFNLAMDFTLQSGLLISILGLIMILILSTKRVSTGNDGVTYL